MHVKIEKENSKYSKAEKRVHWGGKQERKKGRLHMIPWGQINKKYAANKDQHAQFLKKFSGFCYLKKKWLRQVLAAACELLVAARGL